MSARSLRRQRNRTLAKQRARRVALASAASLAGGAGLAATADAATFTVTSLDDAGPGTLRQALASANLTAAPDVVTFQSGLSGKIDLTTGAIPIDAPVDIQGPGPDVIRVAGVDLSHHFDIDVTNVGSAYDDVSISGLKFVDGDDSQGSMDVDSTDLTLTNTVFRGNYGSSTGGAIEFDNGDLTIADSQFIGNMSWSGGGALYIDGDGGTDDDLVITDSVFAGNSTRSDGGALYFDNGMEDLVIERSTFRSNSAEGDGGAMDLYDPSVDAERSIVIRDTLLSGNYTDNDEGGAIYYDGGATDGAGLLIQNSTLSENQAYNGRGGGLYIGYTQAPAQLRSVTIVNNSTPDESGGGIYNDGAEDVVIQNSIIAENSAASDPEDNIGFSGGSSFVISHSLIGDEISALGTNLDYTSPNPASVKFPVDPKLGPLADNGGPTLTHLPADNSPAVDAGQDPGLTADQRGFKRPVDRPGAPNAANGIDIGAVELQDNAVEGGSIAAKGTQKVKKKLKLKLSVGADENATAKAGGVVKSGDLVFDLKAQSKAVPAGGTVTFTLKTKKKKAAKKIAKLLKRGKKAKALFEVELKDNSGNVQTLTDTSKLKGKKKKKKK